MNAMESGRKEHTFLWSIENYSYCWHKRGEKLTSPEFTADGLEGTAWSLSLFPRGNRDISRNHISLYLWRRENDDGPENFSIKYELSVLAVNGSLHCSRRSLHSFKANSACGYWEFLGRDDVLTSPKADYLFQDTLRVHCKLSKGEGNLLKSAHTYARTRIRVENFSYIHGVEHFSSLEPNVKKTIQIRTNSKNGEHFLSSLYISDVVCCERKLVIEIESRDSDRFLFDRSPVISKRKLYLLDASGKPIDCGDADNRFDAARKDIGKLTSFLTTEVILDRKSEYLPGDKLSFLCECTFSTGLEFNKIEETGTEIPTGDVRKTYTDVPVAERVSACPSVADDLKTVYSHPCFTDVELKTKTKSFPAHKVVLAARSPVFKAMLTNDMKEVTTDCIQVDDLEDDTVQRLLSFLYSDKLEDLQWINATDLYYAADKYQIEKLKATCSSFLMDNLSTSTAIELLLLADTHNDSYLKTWVEDFILKNEKQVLGSDEWEKLIEANSQLAAKTMHLKYKGKK